MMLRSSWAAARADAGPREFRDVAVKVPHIIVSVQTAYLDALREEARRAARLSHINIATVCDFRVDGDYA